MAYIGALFVGYEQAGEILNFGAFLAFMGVNLSTFWQFGVVGQAGRKRQWLGDVVIALLGFMFCLWIWLGLKTPAKIVGGFRLSVGLYIAQLRLAGSATVQSWSI